jgi:hypothetical protein
LLVEEEEVVISTVILVEEVEEVELHPQVEPQ